jgi:hypothetical protein
MKIDTQKELKDAFGGNFVEQFSFKCGSCGTIGVEKTPPVMLGKALFSALNMPESQVSEEDAYKKHLLCNRLASDRYVEIDDTDLPFILKQVNKRWPPHLYGVIRDYLESRKGKSSIPGNIKKPKRKK